MARRMKNYLDFIRSRWQNSRAYLEVLRNRLANAQPNASDRPYLKRRIKQIEIETGLWEGRMKED